MAISMNSSVEYAVKATSFTGFGTYGDIMVGNKAFEFYNQRNPEDFIQIPWEEFDYVAAEVIGKRIVRFAIFIKQGGHFEFSSRDNKELLRHVRDHIGEEHMFRSKGFLEVFKGGVLSVAKAATVGVKGLFHRSATQ